MTSYSLFSQANLGQTGDPSTAAFTLCNQFAVSQYASLTGIWFYSASGQAGLPTACAIFQSDTGAVTAGTLNSSPSWSGAAGSGWVKCTYNGAVTLLPGKSYFVAVFRGAGSTWYSNLVNYWTSGAGSGGITNGILSAPSSAGSIMGQSPIKSGGASITYPNTTFSGYNFSTDVEVTPAPPPPSIAQTLAGRNSGRVDIPIIGDSVTEGFGASTYINRYVEKLNTLARQAYPTSGHSTVGGLGFVPILEVVTMTFTALWTGSGGTTIDNGPMRYDLWLSSAGSYAFTAPNPTTSVKIMYFNANSGTTPGTFSYKVNSGSTTNVSNSDPVGVDGALTSSISMNAGDTLTIAWVSGSVFIAGVVHFAQDESTGITFHDCGHYGYSTPAWLAAGGGFDWRPAIANLISGAGAFGVFLGLNDWNTSIGNETAATFQTDLEALIAYLRGNGTLANLSMLLVIPYQSNVTYADSGGYSAYVTAIRNAATVDGHAQVVNLGATMAPAAGSPGYYYDNIHPNDSGHLLIAQAINGALAPSGSGLLMASFP